MSDTRGKAIRSSKGDFESLTLQEQEQLSQKYIATEDLADDALRLGVKTSTLERNVRNYIYNKRKFTSGMIDKLSIPRSTTKPYTEYEVVQGDNFIIISDVEIPDHSDEMLELAMLTGIRHGIKDMIIAGDFVATDQESLNHWLTTWIEMNRTTYRSDVGLGADILREFFKWFETIRMIEGNHDDRVARATGGEVYLGWLLEPTGATYSRYSYIYLDTSRGMIKVCHPESYSANSLGLGQSLYSVEVGPYPDRPQKCHIVLGHTHIASRGWSTDGTHEIIGLGCMRDPLRTKYKMKSSNKHSQWNNGFLMVKNGYMYDYTLKGTNWNEVLGEELYRKTLLYKRLQEAA